VATAETWPWTADEAPEIRVLRRWDDPSGLVESAVAEPGGDAGWLPLESGIEVRFEPAADGGRTFVPGDYWLIPARAATSAIEWPVGPQPARGVRHHYAALALIERGKDRQWTVVDGGDLRTLVSPLDDGFVSIGTAGSTMHGPLSVQPLLRATADQDDLVALRVAPAFDDGGREGVGHTALRVTGGDVTFGAEEQPLRAAVYGHFSVVGTAYARTLDIRYNATVDGALTVSGGDGESGQPIGWALQVGQGPAAFGLNAGTDAGYLRFGDRTGKRFHMALARDAADAPLHTDDADALLTVTDSGTVGINSPAPPEFMALHIVRRKAWGPIVALSGEFDLRSVAKSMSRSAPPVTSVIAGQINSGERQKMYFFWKDADGQLWGSALTQDDAITRNLRNAINQ
jgi:hypothetical protein